MRFLRGADDSMSLVILPRAIACRAVVCAFVFLPPLFSGSTLSANEAGEVALRGAREEASNVLRDACVDCHQGEDAEASLDLSEFVQRLQSGELRKDKLEQWVRIIDRVEAGEMPPEEELGSAEAGILLGPVADMVGDLDREVVSDSGRSVWRRMNRFEYANAVRELLGVPWLQLENMLPEDGQRHGFNKVGEALDVSHVNMARYMQAADHALRAALMGPKNEPAPDTARFYAREQGSFKGRVHYSQFNRSPERATFPLIDYSPDVDVLDDPKHPFTAGAGQPEMREREAFGVVASSYEPIEIRFSSFEAPASGRYTLRFKGYTFWAEGEATKWWRPDRKKTSRGRRSEPVAVYSRLPPRQLRRLGEFDFDVEPSVQTLDVYLLKGETIQPDAVRLFRSRPPAWHNPLAEKDGMPGVAFQWMEVEGPQHAQWPTPGRKVLFGDLPIVQEEDSVALQKLPSGEMIRERIGQFMRAAYRGDVTEPQIDRFCSVVHAALENQLSPTDALLSGYTAILCSPEFLCFREPVGQLTRQSAATRLSLFLFNSLPDVQLQAKLAQSAGDATSAAVSPSSVARVADGMLDDSRRKWFINAFLDYWLDLRKINDTSPDEVLYADYYLDDSLVDAAREETQLYFDALVTENLPVKYLVESDFTFVNERLAQHYGLADFEGVKLRKVNLPVGSVRGGLLTQASVLKVTSNGTTTSPVVRGTFVNERILGIKTPPPPPSVPAIEPDTRGATTIREQLDRHRADATCNKCHKIIDPAGFALESFDVAGGYREHYRSLPPADTQSAASETNESSDQRVLEPVYGFGKNGQPFQFALGPPVDAKGVLPSGEAFADVRELKSLLAENPRKLARNLIEQLVVYGTGSPVRYSDRKEVESILDSLAEEGYPVRSLIVSIASSELFLKK